VVRNRLSDTEYGEVLSCIEGIHRCSSLEEFPQHVLGCLRKLIVCDLSGYNEVNMVRKRMVVYFDPPQTGLEPLLETFGTYMHEHPVITYFDQSGDGQALMISDFLSAREYHKRDIYRNFYRHLNAEDQLSFAVRVESGFMIGIAFNRHKRTFTEKDRMRLNLVRPHVIQAYLHAAELAGQKEHKRDLEAALHKSGVGVISLNEKGNVIHATPGVFDRLSRYIPIPESETPSIPETLLQWALHPSGKEREAPYSVSHDLSRLTVRRVRNEDRILLLLTEDTGLAEGGALDCYRLTAREKEVLKWVAQGKSNSEIATILDLTLGTVKLHVERILVKMGVENRTSAALLARGVL
jgi:DNA-binding CsgD family transcriptional regulator